MIIMKIITFIYGKWIYPQKDDKLNTDNVMYLKYVWHITLSVLYLLVLITNKNSNQETIFFLKLIS